MSTYKKEKVMAMRTVLEDHLDTLERNIEAVSLPVLKTKYKKPYERLCKDIKTATADYVTGVIFQDFRLKKVYLEEVVPIIQAAIRQSGLVPQIHVAALRQDLSVMDNLAADLRTNVKKALEPFYEKHLCLYVTDECLGENPKTPDIYNDATGCILRNGAWIPMDNTENAVLLFVNHKQDNAA